MTSVSTSPERQIESFMPASDVRTTHEIIVHAPATVVFDAAEHLELLSIRWSESVAWRPQ
jgi:hypothetical protein